MRLTSLGPLLFLTAALAGCDPGEGTDGGMDAATDAALRDAARIDAPPAMCTPECDSVLTCCDTGGATSCFDLRNDRTHCGECDVNCLSENRGDGCSASTCTCGSNPLGCGGTREDFCCPARSGESSPYCANLSTSAADCGACNEGCDARVADRCDGGECRCGALRGPCDGTPESICCQGGVDVGCFDTTTDIFHCGGCNNLCRTGERCENGACTTGPACVGGCGEDEICCDGACCTRRSCMAGTCGVPRPDGGVPDAGTADAGVPDAGAPDAATPDAGTADAGTADAG